MKTPSTTTTTNLRFTGKCAIVLGGTSGIGLATCRQLLQHGAERVVAYGRSPERCQAAVQALGAPTNKFSAESLDILNRDALQAALATQDGGFDYLVVAATGGPRAMGPFMEMDMDGFQNSFAKLWGYANAVRFGVPHMRNGGAIVLVSGSPARKCKPGFVALSCVGAAVENLVRATAAELGPKGIRVNGVSPGLIDTPMFDAKGQGKAAFLQQATANNPIARPGTADEVAAGILSLLDNDFITGTVLDVDGGAVIP